MPSEEEKKEWLETARCESLRRDLRLMARNNRESAQVEMAVLLDFLTFMSRLAGEPMPPASTKPHPRMLL